jgi:hypothetical protein
MLRLNSDGLVSVEKFVHAAQHLMESYKFSPDLIINTDESVVSKKKTENKKQKGLTIKSPMQFVMRITVFETFQKSLSSLYNVLDMESIN